MSDLLTEKEARAVLGGISTSTFVRGVRSGRYPKPVRISERVVRWRREDISACIDRLAAERAA